jgi:hypothetical protein
MDNSQDLLRKGFHLAHFIVPDREAALRIVSDATSKLEVCRCQEKKRVYWRHKYLKRKITRMIRQDNDMLQWLIYFEAERHERQHEQAGLSRMDDLVIRYIKSLAQFTTPMSSFYVNVGFQRLLHNYSTAESRTIYERVTAHFPGNEEYRKVKAALMNRLQVRFGNFLKTWRSDRGELRFQPHEQQERFVGLVCRCLSEFTPWSTSQACSLSGPLGQMGWAGNGDWPSKSGKKNLDAIETYRSHIFIHPPCFAHLIQQLGLDLSCQRLSVPLFFLNSNGDPGGNPTGSRKPAPDLSEHERQTIAGRLNREAIRRKQIQPEILRVLVDGCETATMDLSHETMVNCELQEAAKLIEVWTSDGEGALLLATHWIDYSELRQPLRAEPKVNLGKTHQLCMKIIPGDTSARLLLNLRRKPGWAIWKAYSALSNPAEAWPKYVVAMSGLLLVSAIGTIIAYRNETLKQDRTIESIDRALAEERAARAAIQQQLSSSAGSLTPSFRLAADDIQPRGSHAQDITRLVIPLHATLVNLDLPVNRPTPGRYRASLKSFIKTQPLLVEDYLQPTSRGASTVGFVIPASFLVPGTYYVATLEILDESGKQTTSQTFTFYLSDKK